MKKILSVIVLVLCLGQHVVAQFTADYGGAATKTESNDFARDFSVTVNNFLSNSKLTVELSDGSSTVIDKNGMENAVYDATAKTLTITFKISGTEVFIEKNNKARSGTITMANDGGKKIMVVNKVDPVVTTAVVAKGFDPSGYALMDGLSLINCSKRSDFIKILKLYLGSDKDITDAFLKNQGNRYLSDPEVIALLKSKEDDALVIGTGDIVTKAVAAAGGLDVTAFADGFAKFLVKRSKEELSAAFFERFKKDMEKPEYRDLRTVFPQTYRTLQSIGDDIYMFQAYMQALREAFEKDLAALLTNLPTILDNHADYFDQNPELKALLQSAFYIGGQIQESAHPGEIIENYPLSIVEDFGNVKASFQTLKLLSTSLKDENGDGYWADESTLKQLGAADDLLLKIYLGLLQQQSDTIVFFDKDKQQIKLSKVIDASYDDVARNIPEYRKYISGLTGKLRSLEKSIRELKGSKPDSLLFENYYAVVSESLGLMRYLADSENLPRFPKNLHIRDSAAKYFNAIEAASDLAIDIHRRNYASAIMNSVYLYNTGVKDFQIGFLRRSKAKELEITTEKADSLVAGAKDLVAYFELVKKAKSGGAADVKSLLAATEKQMQSLKKHIRIDVVNAVDIAQHVLNDSDETYRNSLDATVKKAQTDLSEASKKLSEFRKEHVDTLSSATSSILMKYGSFMAAIVQAKNSDEVEAAIEAVALPPGSSRIKRTVRFNVALNSYLGLHGGEEKIKIDGTSQWGTIYGVSAPIGIAASTRLCRNCGSVSLFASLIDIGAVASFRFKDETTTDLPPIKLENIFAPGLYAVYGIPKCPISVGYGWQMGPQLREVAIADPNNPGTTMNRNVSGYRWSFFIAVDIPLLNFYSASR